MSKEASVASGSLRVTSPFVRYRHGTEIRVEADVKPVLRPLLEQLKVQPDHHATFWNSIKDIADGAGAGVAAESTWAAALRELFTAFEREHTLEEQTKQPLVAMLEILLSDKPMHELWDTVKAHLTANADALSGWHELKRIRGVSFFGNVQRASDGTYYYVSDAGEKIQIIGAKTAAEERFEYISGDSMSRYGRIGSIFRLISLLDIAEQYVRHPEHFNDRIVCLLPDDSHWTAYLQWSWHVRSLYHHVPTPWKPRSNFSDPEWLAADLLGAFPDARDLSTESISPPQDRNLMQFQEASTENPYQYDLALQTDLFLGENPEVWFDFAGRKVRWINGTRFVYPTLTVWARTGEECSEITRRFLSVLVKEAKTSVIEIAGVGSNAHYYPMIRQPRTIGGLGLDPRYLLTEDTSKFSDQKWLALALYREGVNSGSVYYSLLCFYKILELAFHDKEAQIASWIDTNIDTVAQRRDAKWKQEVLSKGRAASTHFKDARRHAVAHIGTGGKLKSGAAGANPDDPAHYRAFSKDLPIIRELAEMVIERKIV